MRKSLKYQLSKSFGGNIELNKRAIQFKRSWDEVENIISKGIKPGKKGN